MIQLAHITHCREHKVIREIRFPCNRTQVFLPSPQPSHMKIGIQKGRRGAHHSARSNNTKLHSCTAAGTRCLPFWNRAQQPRPRDTGRHSLVRQSCVLTILARHLYGRSADRGIIGLVVGRCSSGLGLRFTCESRTLRPVANSGV
jgi:hypothetical protein